MNDSGATGHTGATYLAAGFIVLVGAALGAIAGAFVVLGVGQTVGQARLIHRAEAVEALIIESGVRTTTTSHGIGAERTTRSTSYGVVVFEFELGGRRLTGDRVWPVGQGGDEAWARGVAARYPVGARVRAWVDPAAPDAAFLEKRWTVGPYIAVFVGSMGLGFLLSLLAGATYNVPTLAAAVAMLGCASWCGAAAWAYTHYLVYAHPSGDPPAWLAYALAPYFLGVALPITLWRLGQRYRRSLEAAGALASWSPA